MAGQSVALYLRIRTSNGSWSFAKAAYTPKNLLLGLHAVVGGRHEHHPEGVYHLRYRVNRKRTWESIGTDASLALVKLQNKAWELHTGRPIEAQPSAPTAPVAVFQPEPMPVQPEHKQRTLAEAITKYLEETRVHKSRKTFLAYRVTLVFYAEHRTGIALTRKQRSCTEDIERVIAALDNTPVTVAKDDLLDYVAFLKKRGNAARTLRNRVDHFQIFMHWTGQKSVLTKNNLPRFTEKKVKAYQRSVLDRMMEHATIDEADLLTFFLCTGVREQEAQYACWTDATTSKRGITDPAWGGS